MTSLISMIKLFVAVIFIGVSGLDCNECVSGGKTFMTVAQENGVINRCVPSDECNISKSTTWHYIQCNTDCSYVVDVGLRDPSKLLIASDDLLYYSDSSCRMLDCETCQVTPECAWRSDGRGEWVCMPTEVPLPDFHTRGCISSCTYCGQQGYKFRSIAEYNQLSNRCVSEEFCTGEENSIGHLVQCALGTECSSLINVGVAEDSKATVGDYFYDETVSCIPITDCTKCQANPNCGWAQDKYLQQGCVPKSLLTNGLEPQDDCSKAPASSAKIYSFISFVLLSAAFII